MTFIILPMLTMLVGFLAGICVMDAFYDNKKLNRLEREMQKLKRRMEE